MPENGDNDIRRPLRVIIDALYEVDGEARARIIRSVVEFFGLGILNGASQGPRLSSHVPSSNLRIESNDRQSSFAERETLSPKDFLHDKQPQTDIDRVECLAFFLSNYRDSPHFKTIDISRLNTEAAQIKFTNPVQTVKNAVNRGLLTSAGRGARQISAIGERYVDALPDRPHPQQVQDLADVISAGSHVGRSPDHHSDGFRVFARFPEIAFQNALGGPLAHLESRLRRNGADIDGVEIAAGGEDVCHPARGRSARAGRYESAVQGEQNVRKLLRHSLETGAHVFIQESESVR